MSLRAGFARADITPAAGLPMGGYAARHGVAGGVLDGLACRAAVFDDGGEPIVVAVLDLVYVAGPWASEVRRRVAAQIGTVPERVLLAATHTHAGPAVFHPGGGRDLLAPYERDLGATVVAAVREAWSRAEPVELFGAAGEVIGVGASRRDPSEAIDRRVRVVFARRADGSHVGGLACFGCHPTVLPPENLHYSRDLFGAAVDRAETALGGTVLLFNGAAADVSTRFTRRAQSAAEVARLGGILGEALASADARRLAPAPISARACRVPVELRPLADEAAAMRAAESAAAALEKAQSTDAGALRLAASRLEGALAQLWLARNGGWQAVLGRVPTAAEVQRLDLGGARVLAVPGELLSGVGHRLSADGDLVVGYANDYLGYLIPAKHAGEGEYESLMAALAPESAAAIERALAEMTAHA